ncbi:LpqB family beta-propeller domain-containing protein [Actinoplanes palleronii]|uniref:Lipoprotein LpqB beta-propeller domain-containing protein n=1 Tax=Actinoplanes palleronii TaxID=113570 RepID=A0ABQ4B685_9ACTN|nr:LpqB family beta-propeller domain-containing protein [Actinoplanes palleronii]GIE66187.1 hypothetical protein Apa02nite_022950 [Actinoplanes palleronii]
MRLRTTGPITLPAVVALVALLTAGCGIPDATGVKDVGPGPSTGISSGDDRAPGEVSREDVLNDRALFVENYLKAAAGDPESALARARKFMTPEAARAFKPTGTALRVIRLVETPLNTPGQDVVGLTYEQVGTLDKFGLLEPATEIRRDTYEIRVGTMPGKDGYFITEAPPALLISDAALDRFYEQQAIYFWNTDYTALVPDVRYMPKAVPPEQRPNAILTWLLNGPAPWLSVSDLPEGTALNGKVPAVSENRLQVNLSGPLPSTDAALALDRLRRQLQWSLRPLLPGELDLKIGHQDSQAYSGNDYLSSNPADRLVADPERFVIYGGKIRRITGTPKSVEAVPVLDPDENKDIQSAGISTSAQYAFAAVVVKDGKNQALRVAGGPLGQQVPLQPISGLSGSLGPPTWAITGDAADDAIGLIAANGHLYSFPSGKGAAQQIPWTGPGTKITSVAVAPDGRRMALVVDGKLYRASLSTSGDTPALGTPQQIRPADLSSVTAVGFNSEGWLTVAGLRSKDLRVTIVDVSIDGALQSPRLSDLGDKPVTALSVYPANPKDASPLTGRAFSLAISYTAEDKAWEVLSTAGPIGVDKLAGPPGNQPAGMVPTAPFYLE